MTILPTRNSLRRLTSPTAVFASAALIIFNFAFLIFPTAAPAEIEQARRIIQETGFQGGVLVHLNSGNSELTGPLGEVGDHVVHGLDADPQNVQQARERIAALGHYGRVAVDRFNGRSLPYADNLVNLVVAEKLGDVPMAEVMRVLAPLGMAYVQRGGQWTKTVKPWPADIDEWTHYLHGADGNAVANDRVVAPPRRYQWIAGPMWLRSHESDSSVKALVTARGRLFYIVDEAPTSLLGDHPLPDKWFLAARDAFNGMPLWKVPIKDWGWQAWKPSWFTPRPGDIPLNIQKRLVAVGDRVYVTLGYRAPLSELDAKTGKVLQTYAGTERTAEILATSVAHRDGALILTVLVGDRAKVIKLDAQSGEQLWTSEKDYGGTITDYYRFSAMGGKVEPAKVDPTLNTAADGDLVALLDGADVVGLDFATGKEKWRAPFPLVEADYKAGNIQAGKTVWTGTLIVKDGAVVHASPNQLAAFAADSGKLLWQQDKKYLGHLWYEWKDVFVIGGLVWTWSAEVARGPLESIGKKQNSSWPVSVNGYDLKTGALQKKVDLGNIFKTNHHHRCYRNKATSRFILASRRGTEFVDLENGQHTVHNWVRGACHLGMMPANGLQYALPHPCVCYIEEKLSGFNALAPAGIANSELRIAKTPRLEKGPAFGKIPNPPAMRSAAPISNQKDWPMYRHDALRSCSTPTEIPANPRLLWDVQVGRKITPPIAVGDRLFVALTDEHQVVALNAADGKRQWRFFAGGRIDSPPTHHQGTVIFGAADGGVYCVGAADGRLVWRFRAAPEERRIGAFGQLESAWPVHGSVLVQDGVVYFAAGRTSELDGGIHLFGLDAASGDIRRQTRLEGPDYAVEGLEQNYQLPMGTLPDILQSDGETIYMRDTAFDAKLERRPASRSRENTRVQAKGGLLDDSYFKRIPWTFGPGNNYARLIVHDDRAAFFVRMFDSLKGLDPKVYFTPGEKGYLLFAVNRETGKQTWGRRIPLRINAMVATGGGLFVAGVPDVVDPKDPLAAFEGRKGGRLAACDRASGEVGWEHSLPAAPAFNGLIAADRRLYVATQDGRLTCFGK